MISLYLYWAFTIMYVVGLAYGGFEDEILEKGHLTAIFILIIWFAFAPILVPFIMGRKVTE